MPESESLIELLMAAYQVGKRMSVGEIKCPVMENPPLGVTVQPVPTELRGLIAAWIGLRERSRAMLDDNPNGGNDGGAWFTANNETDAAHAVVIDLLRRIRNEPLGTRYDFYAGWCYVVRPLHGVTENEQAAA